MAEKSLVHVEFYMRAVQDKKATRDEGRPIYRDAEYCRIKFPGDRRRMVDAPAHEKVYMAPGGGPRMSYAEMYPEHYKLFQANAQQVVGTPIAELTFLTEAQRATLKAQNVLTVENLAALDGGALKSLGMGARAWKDQAAAYLEVSKGNAGTAKLAAENAELREMMAALQAQMSEMQTKRGPGRPRKEEAEAAA